MTTITDVKEIFNFKPEKHTELYGEYDGFEIKTTDSAYKILISNYSSCCENWGYFSTPDDPKSFIGSTLKMVKVTDTALQTKKLEDIHLDAGGVCFVNFETDKGTLQFTAYNAHNGYYGHNAVLLVDGDPVQEWSL